MDAAYDHIQEEVLRPDEAAGQAEERQQEGGLNTEFQEAYRSFTASPWGARLGGFFGSVKKQGETIYQEARQEASAASEEALKGFTDLRSTLVNRARSLSTNETPQTSSSKAVPGPEDFEDAGSEHTIGKERTSSETLRESEGILTRFRTEAAKRLKDIEKAEDAADEALLKFGTNIRNFLRDAVSIAPPSEEMDQDGKSKVLFESKDQDGKRVIHTTRFDAQVHVIHWALESFTKDPISPEYEKWKSDFNVEEKTDDISADLEKHEKLRRVMENLVPEQVEYEQFWKRYYFLRMVIESEQKRRKELLKGATLSPDEEVGWDEDSDSEPSTPQAKDITTTFPTSAETPTSKAPTPQVNAPIPITSDSAVPPAENDTLKPNEPRKSQDQHSQPDSDASYDLVSGAASQAPESPREENGKDKKDKKKEGPEGAAAAESDEEDWE